jgi:hypothetical protein
MNEKLTKIRDNLKITDGMATIDPADYEWLFVKAMQYFELKKLFNEPDLNHEELMKLFKESDISN